MLIRSVGWAARTVTLIGFLLISLASYCYQTDTVTTTVVDNLKIPWGLAFLPDKRLIFTQRDGRLSMISLSSKNPKPQTVTQFPSVTADGEGGLLGVAVDPRFARNHWLFLYYTYREGSVYYNRVVRYQLNQRKLEQGRILVDNIPGARIHDGGRLKFGPDGYLYITTGDASQPRLAQNLQSLAGKILRVKSDGSIPADNPFTDSPVYSYGHRNPQGIAWDAKGRLWATEHGSWAHDEINLIKPGANYGWPIIRGSRSKSGMRPPVLNSGRTTWAPSGALVKKGVLYFAGLRGETLYGFNIHSKRLAHYLEHRFGRLRTVIMGPDDRLYIATSNRDGRGSPRANDDRIIKIDTPLQ